MKKVLRSVYVLSNYMFLLPLLIAVGRKNVAQGYSDAEIKVRNATSNEPWSPAVEDMVEIARLTFDRHNCLY